jgi:hypothetical protein
MGFPAIAGGAGIAGALLSAFGTIEGGQATKNAASYSAQVAANNAIIAQQNAKYAAEAGQTQATAEALKGAATGGAIKGGQAASGVDVNTGSAVDVQTSQRETSKLNTETTLNNAQLQAYGYRTQATGYQAQSQLDLAQAQQAPIGADLAASGGLLSSASALGLKWSQLGSTPSPTPPPPDPYATATTTGYAPEG